MNGNRKPHIFVLRAAAVLLVLVLLTTSVVSGRYARYVSTASGGDRARIAAYVFDVRDDTGHYIDVSDIRNPGDSKSYQFTVRNHNGAVSEVNEAYLVTMELRGSLPLVCTLSDGDTITLNGMNVNAQGLTSGQGAIHTFTASVKTGKEYTLTVSWPDTENDVKYSRAGLSELVLTIAAQQVD